MADTFQLEIVTPEKLMVKEAAEEAQIPGMNGYLGILPGHAPLITELAVGVISYRASGETHNLAVAWGFAEVLPDKVTILAEAAEDFSGAELEEAINSALYEAFHAGVEVTTDHIREALGATVPLARTMDEQIRRLRHWADGRARRASQ